jgi:hypothetical protein
MNFTSAQTNEMSDFRENFYNDVMRHLGKKKIYIKSSGNFW